MSQESPKSFNSPPYNGVNYMRTQQVVRVRRRMRKGKHVYATFCSVEVLLLDCQGSLRNMLLFRDAPPLHLGQATHAPCNKVRICAKKTMSTPMNCTDGLGSAYLNTPPKRMCVTRCAFSPGTCIRVGSHGLLNSWPYVHMRHSKLRYGQSGPENATLISIT